MKKKECIRFIKCDIEIWRKKLIHEIIVHFAKKAIYLKEGDINLVGISRTHKNEKIKMFLAGAWIYPDENTRLYLRIKIKPKKFEAGLNIDIKTNKSAKMVNALQGLKEIAKTWQEIIEKKYQEKIHPNKENNLSPGWSKTRR